MKVCAEAKATQCFALSRRLRRAGHSRLGTPSIQKISGTNNEHIYAGYNRISAALIADLHRIGNRYALNRNFIDGRYS